MPESILGLSAFYHDSAAALLIDGEIIAAAHEERFTRKKHDSSFPKHATKYVLTEAGLSLNDLSAVAFYDKPYLKFERLLETYHEFAPRGLRSFLSAIPVWIKEKLFMKKMLREKLAHIGPGKPKLLFPEHHLSHAASAFFPSPFKEASILTIDGVGEWATGTIGHGTENKIKVYYELEFPHSLGLLYSAFTYYCGFKVNSGEYKLMGLAPYGNPESDQTLKWKKKIYDEMIMEVHRILKNNGKLIIYTPNPYHFTELLKRHNILLKRDVTHVDYKTMPGLRKSLSERGFHVEKSYYIESHLPVLNVIERLSMKFVPFFRRRIAILAIKKISD